MGISHSNAWLPTTFQIAGQFYANQPEMKTNLVLLAFVIAVVSGHYHHHKEKGKSSTLHGKIKEAVETHVKDKSLSKTNCTTVYDDVWEESCLTKYNTTCRQDMQPKCKPVKVPVCAPKTHERCSFVFEDKCTTISLPKCSLEWKKHCHNKPECKTTEQKVCKNVEKVVCVPVKEPEVVATHVKAKSLSKTKGHAREGHHFHHKGKGESEESPRQICRNQTVPHCDWVSKEVCLDKEVCKSWPKKKCGMIKKETCAPFPAKTCEEVTETVCDDVWEDKCIDVKVEICVDIPNKRCEKKLVKKPRTVCHTPPKITMKDW